MNTVEISTYKNGERQTAMLLCDSKNLTITFTMENGDQKSYAGTDFYKYLGKVRADQRDVIFLCKGEKINVHPSTMSSQISLGLKAYELTLGERALLSDIVNIFDTKKII